MNQEMENFSNQLLQCLQVLKQHGPFQTSRNLQEKVTDGKDKWDKMWKDIHVYTHPFPHTFR